LHGFFAASYVASTVWLAAVKADFDADTAASTDVDDALKWCEASPARFFYADASATLRIALMGQARAPQYAHCEMSRDGRWFNACC
jgi:hypothetical protein